MFNDDLIKEIVQIPKERSLNPQYEYKASSTTVSLCLSSVDRACHGFPDQFLEGNFPDPMFPRHLGSDDESQSEFCMLSDRMHK